MSSTRYIEIYSAHRNRNRYPHPSSFEIPFSPSRRLINGSHATDPLINGAIYYTFSGKLVIDSGLLKSGSKDSNPLLEISNIHPQSSLPNFYLGLMLPLEHLLNLTFLPILLEVHSSILSTV